MTAIAYSLRLEGSIGPSSRARFEALARMLGIEDADRLARALPATLALAPIDAPTQARIADRIAVCGLTARWDPARLQFPPCEVHPRLAADAVCPRCEERRYCWACGQRCPACTRQHARRRRFRRVRVALLLAILGAVGLSSWLDARRLARWDTTLSVRVHPIAADPVALAYVDALGPAALHPVGAFFDREAEAHGLALRPVLALELGPPLEREPPEPPKAEGTEPSVPAIMFWSLKLRWFAWRAPGDADIRVFAVYHAPKPALVLEESLGLAKGRVGVVHLFASDAQAEQNAIVIAHEVLHTVGASDKYGPTGVPLFPAGWADPGAAPSYPAARAEIMGGRIPLSATEAKMPETLEDCVIGAETAREIGWPQPQSR